MTQKKPRRFVEAFLLDDCAGKSFRVLNRVVFARKIFRVGNGQKNKARRIDEPEFFKPKPR